MTWNVIEKRQTLGVITTTKEYYEGPVVRSSEVPVQSPMDQLIGQGRKAAKTK